MKKYLLFLIGLFILSHSSMAQEVQNKTVLRNQSSGFNRVSLGYDAMFLNRGFNTMNGVQLQYIHGFRISKHPVLIECGVGVIYNFKDYINNPYETHDTKTLSSLSVKIPINLSYKINVNNNFSIQPHFGVNWKINPIFDYERGYYLTYEDDPNVNYVYFTDRTELKLFQVGAQLGIGFNISQFYVGVEYSMDFLPRAHIYGYHKIYNDYGMNPINHDSFDINSNHLSVSLGLSF